DERDDFLLRARADREHRDHRGDAEDHAEHRENRPQLVRAEVVEALADFRPHAEVTPRAHFAPPPAIDPLFPDGASFAAISGLTSATSLPSVKSPTIASASVRCS